MSDILMTIIAILVSVTLLFIFPILNITVEHDKTVQSVIETLNCDYVETIAEQGIITLKDYEKFQKKVFATGYAYDITFEIKILDENIAKVETSNENAKYYSVFTDEILKNLDREDYYLKRGDLVTVNVENKTKTLGMQFKNFLYQISNNEKKEIYSSCTLPVSNNGIESINVAGKISNKEYIIDLIGEIDHEIKKINKYYVPFNLYVCLDTSCSMGKNSTAETTTELDAGKQAIINILKQAKLEKNTIKVITFNDAEAKLVVDSAEIEGSVDNKKKEVEKKVEEISATLSHSSFNKLLPEIKKIDESMPKDEFGGNNYIIIFTDGVVTNKTTMNPRDFFGTGNINVDNIWAVIYNLNNNEEWLLKSYEVRFDKATAKERYVAVHPIITMGVIMGKLNNTDVMVKKSEGIEPDFANLKNIIEREKYGEKEWTQCILPGNNLKATFEQVLEEVEKKGTKETTMSARKSTNNKILTLSKEIMDTTKEITITIGGDWTDTICLSDPESYKDKEYITVDENNLMINFKKIKQEIDEEISIKYYINSNKLVSKT